MGASLRIPRWARPRTTWAPATPRQRLKPPTAHAVRGRGECSEPSSRSRCCPSCSAHSRSFSCARLSGRLRCVRPSKPWAHGERRNAADRRARAAALQGPRQPDRGEPGRSRDDARRGADRARLVARQRSRPAPAPAQGGRRRARAKAAPQRTSGPALARVGEAGARRGAGRPVRAARQSARPAARARRSGARCLGRGRAVR